MNNSPFMKKVRDTLRFKQMALSAEKNYCYWISFFIRYHNYASPEAIRSNDVTSFLTQLAVTRHVSPGTQNQAFNALLFLFRHVLNMPFDNVDAVRAKEVRRIPVVLSNSEVQAVVDQLNPAFRTVIQLAWGAGMRKMEIRGLRVKDIDFERRFRAAERYGIFSYCFAVAQNPHLRRLSLRPPTGGGQGLKFLVS